MVFNRVQVPNATYTDIVHDTGTLLIRNTGSAPLTITSMVLSDTTNWAIVNPPSGPVTIAPGATMQVSVKFMATAAPVHTTNQTNDTTVANDPGYNVKTAAGVWSGTLTLNTNDPANSAKVVTLAGWWQHLSEHEEEPGLQTLVNQIYGYTTNISNTYLNFYTEGASTPTYYGEEVVSPFWSIADSNGPVTAQHLAAYHQQASVTTNADGTTTTAPTEAVFGWYTKGSTTTKYVIRNNGANGQSLLPTNNVGGAVASFTPTGASFGFSLDGNFSEDSRNTVGGGGGHHVRFYPLRDGTGNIVPNSYLAVLDYGSATYENYDFQDNVYLVTNIKPAGRTSQPINAQATSVATGGINVQWAPVSSSALLGYNVYRSTSATGSYTKLTSTPLTSPSYFDAQAPSGITSFYKITAVDSTTGESLGSTASSVNIPAAPSGLVATATVGRFHQADVGIRRGLHALPCRA